MENKMEKWPFLRTPGSSPEITRPPQTTIMADNRGWREQQNTLGTLSCAIFSTILENIICEAPSVFQYEYDYLVRTIQLVCRVIFSFGSRFFHSTVFCPVFRCTVFRFAVFGKKRHGPRLTVRHGLYSRWLSGPKRQK